jgi:hypothetical protein
VGQFRTTVDTDDIAIFASSQRSAERILESVVKWLNKELKLEVNRTKSGAGPTEQSGLLVSCPLIT